MQPTVVVTHFVALSNVLSDVFGTWMGKAVETEAPVVQWTSWTKY